MKRSAVLLLISIYLVFCLGMGVNSFYCCGKLASVSMVFGWSDNAGIKTINNNKCCKNEVRSFKLKDKQVLVQSYSFKAPLPSLLPAFAVVNINSVYEEVINPFAYRSNAPPGKSGIPIYLRNCDYRI